jgi:hypothetical protein
VKHKTEPDELAFPSNLGMIHKGLTKREWFASQAVSALISRGYDEDVASRRAVIVADLIIKELNKEK